MNKLTILGLGPVGLATTWSLLRNGHHVDAYDVNPLVSEQAAKGEFPKTPQLAEDLRQELGNRFLVHSTAETCFSNKYYVICVESPWRGREFDLSALRSALDSILSRASEKMPHIIVRSTLIPGTLDSFKLNCDVSYYPEFLRMPNIRDDLLDPPLRVAAHSSPSARDAFLTLFPDADQELPDFSTAEILKLACNAFHALKVVFANEIGDICEKAGISPKTVMDAFCKDHKLNISEKYLKPGAPFGGVCLDKDLRALEDFMTRIGIDGDLLRSIRTSNDKRYSRFELAK